MELTRQQTALLQTTLSIAEHYYQRTTLSTDIFAENIIKNFLKLFEFQCVTENYGFYRYIFFTENEEIFYQNTQVLPKVLLKLIAHCFFKKKSPSTTHKKTSLR